MNGKGRGRLVCFSSFSSPLLSADWERERESLTFKLIYILFSSFLFSLDQLMILVNGDPGPFPFDLWCFSGSYREDEKIDKYIIYDRYLHEKPSTQDLMGSDFSFVLVKLSGFSC